MNKTIILNGSIAALACMSLSGCLGTGGGTGGGGGGGGSSVYQDNFERVQYLGPQTERQNGSVNYIGKTRLETAPNTGGTSNGFFVGDLSISANFDNGTLSGTATNFVGEVDGEAVTLAGTLDSANTQDPNIVAQQDVVLPPVAGGGTITSGSLIASMRGTLTESINNESTTAELGLIGTFVGTNATGAMGTAAMLLGDEQAAGFVIGGGGTFYLDRQ